MVGVPLLGGFMGKLCLAEAAFGSGGARMWILLGALALSTLLNAFYFLHTVVGLYRKPREGFDPPLTKRSALTGGTLWACAVINLLLGIFAQPILRLLEQGLKIFG